MTTEEAMNHLKTQLKNDEQYRYGWISNLAMSYIDLEKSYRDKTKKKYLNQKDKVQIANDAAKNFIQILLQQ